MSVYHMGTVPEGARGEGISSPGTGVSDVYEPPCGCWEMNPLGLWKSSLCSWLLSHLSSLNFFFFNFMYICVCERERKYVYMYLCACIYMYYMHSWYSWRAKEGIGCPGARVSEGCGLSCGCLEPNSDLLQEQPTFLCHASPAQFSFMWTFNAFWYPLLHIFSIIFLDKVLLCSLGWPRTLCVDHADLQLMEIFAFPPCLVLGLQVYTIMPGSVLDPFVGREVLRWGVK